MQTAAGEALVIERARVAQALRTPTDACRLIVLAVEIAQAGVCLGAARRSPRRPTPNGGTSATDGRDE